MKDEIELITFKTFDNSFTAHIIKGHLESEGIECYLFDENINTLNPLYNILVGGIKLKINSNDFVRAETLLAETENRPILDEQGRQVACPQCRSTDFYTDFKSIKSGVGILSAIVSFALMVYPIYYKTVCKCKKCGSEFNINREY